MTLIERINGFVNAVAGDIKSLYANKVNKTDVIDIAHGGTGGTDASTARVNLELGTAATKDVTTTAYEKTAGRITKVGDFGIGGNAPIFANITNIAWETTETATLFNEVHRSTGGAFFSNTRFNINGRYTPTFFNYLVSGLNGGGLFAICGDVVAGDFFTISGAPDSNHPLKLNTIYHDGCTPKLTGTWAALKSGAASYPKGWRKLTATLPSQAGEIIKAHGVTTVETVQAKATNTDGIIIYNNDIDPTNQFYVRVNGANLVLGVTANSTKVFGQSVTIYVGEEL
jgi:hypothetical protein